MKIKHKEKIGGYIIIRCIVDASIDTEATKAKIAPLINEGLDELQIKKLYMDNLAYAKVGAEGELIEYRIAEQLQIKLDGLGPNQLLLDSGEYIVDNRGLEYWVQRSGEWVQEKIEEIGVSLPAGAILPGNLSREQHEEITRQKEVTRITALTTEQKAEERRQKLYALPVKLIKKRKTRNCWEKYLTNRVGSCPRRQRLRHYTHNKEV